VSRDPREIPAYFQPVVTRETVRGGAVWVWRESVPVNGVPTSLEYAQRHPYDEPMRRHIWHLIEHARLGNHQHIAHARQDRHARRPKLMGGQTRPNA
jgi:hypothetical protein